MTILHDYETRVDCDESHCSLRYYIKGIPLSVGIIRASYHDKGGINGLIITISDWNVGELLQDISDNNGLGPNEMLNYMGELKNSAISTIKEHITKSMGHPASD